MGGTHEKNSTAGPLYNGFSGEPIIIGIWQKPHRHCYSFISWMKFILLYVHSNERAINLIELSNCLNACACLPKQKLFELKLLPDSIFYLCFSNVL